MKRCRFCRAPLAERNTIGACRQHRHRLEKPTHGKRCGVCGDRLRSDNKSGRCVRHRSNYVSRRRYRPCSVPGCAERRVPGGMLCLGHRTLWRRSQEYFAARAAWRVFLKAAAANHAQPPESSPLWVNVDRQSGAAP